MAYIFQILTVTVKNNYYIQFYIIIFKIKKYMYQFNSHY